VGMGGAHRGRLRRRDELDQWLRIARLRVGARMRRLAANPGRAAGGLPAGPVQWQVAQSPPDSAFARAAFAAAREASSDILLGHCLRTWLWADLVAQADRVRHDPELLYAACILHDLGLTPAHWCRRATGPGPRTGVIECFGVEGGLAAYDLAIAHGYRRARELAEAIMLHLNVEVPLNLGAEAHLLSAAAAMDLLGRRTETLPAHVVSPVLARHPRDGFAAEIERLSAEQAAARPRSRVALLRRMGLPDLIRRGEAAFKRLDPDAPPTTVGR
jgi:hypothetical protein